MRTAAFVMLMMIPVSAGCASLPLPMDGSLVRGVADRDRGSVCECSTSKPESVCYCGPQMKSKISCGAP